MPPLVTVIDAVTVDAVPEDVEFGSAYVDGKNTSGNYAEWRAKRPNAKLLKISTTGKTAGVDYVDVENFDASPTTAANGMKAGLFPAAYCTEDTKAVIDQLMRGVPWEWIDARPDGKRSLTPGSVMTQWAWPAHTVPAGTPHSPGDYDINVATPTWLARKFPSPPAPEVTDMQSTARDEVTGGIWLTDPSGELFAEFGAPFIPGGGLNAHPTWHAGAAESGGAMPVVAIEYWGKPGGIDGIVYICQAASGAKNPDGSPYFYYRFQRSGTVDSPEHKLVPIDGLGVAVDPVAA